MARVKVDPGACGLPTRVEVVQKGKNIFHLEIRSECEMVQRLERELPALYMLDAFKRVLDNPVYKMASICVKHVSCPVPCAILKALEAEAGLAVPKDIVISFEKEK